MRICHRHREMKELCATRSTMHTDASIIIIITPAVSFLRNKFLLRKAVRTHVLLYTCMYVHVNIYRDSFRIRLRVFRSGLAVGFFPSVRVKISKIYIYLLQRKKKVGNFSPRCSFTWLRSESTAKPQDTN